MLETPETYNRRQQTGFYQPYTGTNTFDDATSPYADPPLIESGVRPTTIPISQYSPVPPVQPPLLPPDDRPSGGQPSKPSRSGRGMIILSLVILLVFGTGIFAGVSFATNHANTLTPQSTATTTVPSTNSTGSTNGTETQREAAIQKAKGAVVQINVTLANGSGIGSGFVIDKDGYIATNNHVVAGAQSVEVVLIDGSTHTGRVVGTDPADDLAVVKIDPPANLVVATWGDSSKLTIGQEVLAIGNPLGITQTVTSGIVSALNRTMSESGEGNQSGATIPNMIQTDAPINPGNSGGALIDLQGNIVGMPTLGATTNENQQADGLGFAISSNRIKLITDQLIKDGKVTHTGRPLLGVTTTADRQGDTGALVASVVTNGPAAQAGMQVNDRIIKVDDQTIDSPDTLGEVLAMKQPGQKVNVTVQRGGQQITLSVTLGELPAGA